MTKQTRRLNALKRLQQQLDSGYKTKKGTRDVKVKLDDSDILRIEKEIKRVKEKV